MLCSYQPRSNRFKLPGSKLRAALKLSRSFKTGKFPWVPSSPGGGGGGDGIQWGVFSSVLQGCLRMLLGGVRGCRHGAGCWPFPARLGCAGARRGTQEQQRRQLAVGTAWGRGELHDAPHAGVCSFCFSCEGWVGLQIRSKTSYFFPSNLVLSAGLASFGGYSCLKAS